MSFITPDTTRTLDPVESGTSSEVPDVCLSHYIPLSRLIEHLVSSPMTLPRVFPVEGTWSLIKTQ